MSSTTFSKTTIPAIAGNTLLADAVIRPILFSTQMVEAILAERKTQTRRIVKEPFQTWMQTATNPEWWKGIETQCKHGQIGDFLWVRETWQYVEFGCEPEEHGYVYKASENGRDWQDADENWKWKPSLFMPKEACRLFLQITKIRAERIQDISEEDAINEGVSRYPKSPIYGYKNYLDKDTFCLTAKQSF